MERDPDRRSNALVGDLALRLANGIVGACAERGVLAMPLKGALLLARWPGFRGRRDLSDVDFLVRQSDVPAMVDALATMRFEPTVRTGSAVVFANDTWPLSVDVHTDLFPYGMFGMSTEGVFSRAEADRSLFVGPVALMSPADLLAHLIGHFVKGRGSFPDDRSLEDIRWLIREDVFRAEDAERMATHCREQGLQRAAAYVFGDDSFVGAPFSDAFLLSLELPRPDLIAVAVARAEVRANSGTPRLWTPHLLDRSWWGCARSMATHAEEGMRRLITTRPNQGGATSRTRSAARAIR